MQGFFVAQKSWMFFRMLDSMLQLFLTTIFEYDEIKPSFKIQTGRQRWGFYLDEENQRSNAGFTQDITTVIITNMVSKYILKIREDIE